jgi:ABC-type multidrug transport system ATPase subunit
MRVELYQIERIYKGRKVVDIESLTFESGKIYAVVGPNGSGKTTMLRILAGQDREYKGEILYNGASAIGSSHIGYMPQSSYMFDYSVIGNVMLGLVKKNTKGEKVEALRRAERALENVGMAGFLNVNAKTLSGGEAQRVALARTLALERELVLLDEPASATDLSGVELVENYIRSVNRECGSTIVFTTHNPSQAAHIADEVIMMYNGRVLEMGSPSMVFESPRCQETRDFLRNWRI